MSKDEAKTRLKRKRKNVSTLVRIIKKNARGNFLAA